MTTLGDGEIQMGRVFANIGLSLDGYMAPEGMTVEHWEDPEHLNWGAKWGALMGWIFELEHFRENLQLGEGGETGPVNDLQQRITDHTGANIMGKRMFDQGAIGWPEDAPFHTPVFVLTHERRDPWARLGGTTFYFVNDGPERALELARKAAGDRDIRISGGANVLQQFLRLGVIEELEIAQAPVIFGGGQRLFEGISDGTSAFRIADVIGGPLATHICYKRTE